MDGNGRWARKRHLPRIAGHRAGVTSVRSTVETAARIGIPSLTLYAFSEENWKKRPKGEVGFLMGLLCRYLKAEVPTLNNNNIRLEYIGRQHELPIDVQEKMGWARDATRQNTGMVLTLALNYSARSELVDAFRSIMDAAASNGGLQHLKVSEELVSQHLYTRDLPDPDSVIRTSGEMRLSNFLLWQLAYAEILVTQTLWPEFRGAHCWKASPITRSANAATAGSPKPLFITLLKLDGARALASSQTNPDRSCSDSHRAAVGFAHTNHCARNCGSGRCITFCT